MPILEYHLVEGRYDDDQIEKLLLGSSLHYADVLKCPLDRVRVFVHLHKPQHVAVAGRLLSQGGDSAPYFHFLVLEGRSQGECDELLTGFTDLVVEFLGAERSQVRGGCWPIPPQYWAIGGKLAAGVRADEIRARTLAVEKPFS